MLKQTLWISASKITWFIL